MYRRWRKLGFSSYKEYLASDYWRSAKQRYFESNLPKYCISCNSSEFQLHHRSYTRLGQEILGDLIPLCGICHRKLHEFLKASPIRLAATPTVLRKMNNWTKDQTREIFRPFIKDSNFNWVKGIKVRKGPMK